MAAAQHTLSKGRRRAIAALLVVAVITGFLAIFATWIKRQALDTHHWTTTSTRLIQDKKVQATLGAYLTDQLFTQVDVQGQLRQTLPQPTQALAGPVAGVLRGVADRAAPELLARPRVQDTWKKANEAAHKQLIAILNGGGKTVSTANGEVTLDLHNLVDQLAATVGLEDQVAAAREKLNGQGAAALQERGITVPASSGKLVIMKSSELKTAQDIAKAVRGISILLTILTLLCFALAVFLAGGERRRYLRRVGWCFVGVGIAILLVRRVGGNQVVDGLVKADSVKPAAHDAWNIGTSLLRTMAITAVIYGLLLVVGAWLAGQTRPAQALRRALAPSMRERPALVYGVGAAIYILALAVIPTPAFRNPVTILLIGALLVAGLESLRRQAAREFPDAQRGDAMLSLRTWWAARTHTVAATGNGSPVGDLEPPTG